MKPTKRKKLRLGQTLLARTARMPSWRVRMFDGNAQVYDSGELRLAPAVQWYAAPDFADGDYVTRDGSDVHQVRGMTADGFAADFVCIKAPASGWCAVGDVEHNLCRRYSKVEAVAL